MCFDRHILLWAFLLANCGCTVMEDREECPCYLTVDWSGVDCWSMLDAGNEQLAWQVSTTPVAQWLQSGTLALETLAPTCEIPVPRDTVRLSVACGAEMGPDGGVTTPEGEGFPRLYYYSSDVDATGITARDTVMLHREHAELFLYIRNVMQAGASYSVEGTVQGCDRTGRPLLGKFSSRIVTDSRGFGSIVVPRQVDGSLRLNVSYAGEVVRSLAIGEYIIQSGYDWSALDLEDISMEIDYYQTKVTVKIEQWKKTLTFTIVF